MGRRHSLAVELANTVYNYDKLDNVVKNYRKVNRWAYKIVSMAGVRKVKWYIELKCNFLL